MHPTKHNELQNEFEFNKGIADRFITNDFALKSVVGFMDRTKNLINSLVQVNAQLMEEPSPVETKEEQRKPVAEIIPLSHIHSLYNRFWNEWEEKLNVLKNSRDYPLTKMAYFDNRILILYLSIEDLGLFEKCKKYGEERYLDTYKNAIVTSLWIVQMSKENK